MQDVDSIHASAVVFGLDCMDRRIDRPGSHLLYCFEVEPADRAVSEPRVEFDTNDMDGYTSEAVLCVAIMS